MEPKKLGLFTFTRKQDMRCCKQKISENKAIMKTSAEMFEKLVRKAWPLNKRNEKNKVIFIQLFKSLKAQFKQAGELKLSLEAPLVILCLNERWLTERYKTELVNQRLYSVSRQNRKIM